MPATTIDPSTRQHEFYRYYNGAVAVFAETKDEMFASKEKWEAFLPIDGNEPNALVVHGLIHPGNLGEPISEDEARSLHPRLLEMVDATKEETFGYHGTMYLTYKRGDHLASDDGTPYVAVAQSQWYQEQGYYETPCVFRFCELGRAILRERWPI